MSQEMSSLNSTNITSISNISNVNTTDSILHGDSIYDDVLNGIKYVDIVLLPTCMIFGITGNFITMVVMNMKAFSKLSSRYFLIALAISDNILLLTQPFNKSLVIQLFGTDLRALSSSGCKLFFWFFRNGKMTSSWFVVYLCVERFVAVQFPFRVKAIFCKRNCIIMIVLVYIVLGAYNGAWSWASDIKEDGFCHPDTFDKTDPDAATLYKNMLYAGCTLYTFAPIFIMATVTPMIIANLTKRSQERKKMTSNHAKDKDLGRITTMLLSIVIGYIVLVTPVTVLHLLSFYKGVNAFGANPKPFLVYRGIVQILEQLNYTINFFLYVLSNPRFRENVAKLLKCPGRSNIISKAKTKSKYTENETDKEGRSISKQ